MDPVTAALNTLQAFIELQNNVFNAMPDADKAVMAKQVYTDLQGMRDLVQKIAGFVKGL